MNGSASLPATLAELLHGAPGRSVRQQIDAMRPDAVMHAVGDAGAEVVRLARHEVGQVVDDVLGMSTIDVVELGWRKHRVLSEAARRTHAEPGRCERVTLASHTIAVQQPLPVEVEVDGVTCGTIEFELAATAVVDGLVAVVERGRLTRLEAGSITLDACLSVAGKRLTPDPERPPTFDLSGSLALGDGIALVSGA